MRSPIPYSVAELAWVKSHRKQPRSQAHAAFCEKFKREDVSLANFKNLCKRNGWWTGRTGCFVPGNRPANKGKKMPFNASIAKTQFKKGCLPHNAKHLGHERVNNDGYVEIKIAAHNPRTDSEQRYVVKHQYLWIQANGPVPEGMCLKCLDGDRTNTDPSNWQAIPRAMMPRLNGIFGRDYETAPPELKPTIMAITRLEHRALVTRRNQK